MNSLSPILSIVTINKNNSQGLDKTLKSILRQTYSDFDHIIIDGASIDGSLDIIGKYAELTRYKLYWSSEPDSGIYEAMNKGIRMSNGMYILFLNSGDYFVNDSILENFFNYQFIEEIVIGNCSVTQNGRVVFNAVPPDEISLFFFTMVLSRISQHLF